MNSFTDLARLRVSIRGYRSDPVPDQDVGTVLEAAGLAPTACNRQPFRLFVLQSEAARAAAHAAYPRDWLAQAPVIILICTDPEKAWSRADGKNYADVDASIAMDHLTLCATELGLGTCWIGAFDPDLLRTGLNLPANLHPLAMTPLGWPTDTGRPKNRKLVKELVEYC